MEGGSEPGSLRNGGQGLFAGGHEASGARESRAQQILPRGEAGLLTEDAAEIGISHAESSCEGLQVHIFALVLGEVLLRAAHDPSDSRWGFCGVWQFRTESEQFVSRVRQFWHGVLAATREEGLQFLKQFCDSAALDALEDALPSIDDSLLDQSPHHPAQLFLP